MLHSYESKLRNQTFSEILMKSENTLPVQIFKQADKWCNAMNAKSGSIVILKNYHQDSLLDPTLDIIVHRVW